MTEAALLKVRAKNAKLMNGNLALLMALRETEADIDDLREELQKKCSQLEQRGLPVPASCVALLNTKAHASNEDASRDADDPMGGVAPAPATGQDTTEPHAGAGQPPPAPASTQSAASKVDIKALVSGAPSAQSDA